MRQLRTHSAAAYFAVTVVLLTAGLLLQRRGHPELSAAVWAASTALGLLVCAAWVAGALRRRETGVDVIALLALAGTLATGEHLAGAIIAWMLATGSLLEERAEARAHRELSLLLERAPRTARRRASRPGERARFDPVPVGELRQGDEVLVGPGEIVPVDGRLAGPAALDESALTGESLPVDRTAGDGVRSGSVNAGGPLTMIATATAADSTYAQIVRLVEQARTSSAPFVRRADRIALAFVPVTLGLAGAAWLLAGDVSRAVAVLVVATPCPLLLAAPIAIMSGLSRAASLGVIVKGGAVLERLAAGRVLLFDKTGTLTRGRPVVVDVVTAPDGDATDLLRLAAGLDQVSPHVLATAVVAAARKAAVALMLPTGVHEHHGYGVEGTVDGHVVRVGKAAWVLGDPLPGWARAVRRRSELDGSLTVFVAVDGVPAGALLLEDPVRSDAPRMVRSLRRAGLDRVVLVTGDRADVAEAVGRIVGVDAVHADSDPAAKLAVLTAESVHGVTIMVGDGINDAPALAAADVGVALAARGATASSQAADVVLTVDRLDRLADAIAVARRSQRIALQSVVVGMGLCAAAMLAAAAGWLPAAHGALLQEGIDVLAIAVALRAVLPHHSRVPGLTSADSAVIESLHAQHSGMGPIVEQVRAVADHLAASGRHGPATLAPARELLSRLQTELVPHERAEEVLLHPLVARIFGGEDPTGAMSRAHAEIEHQVIRFARLLAEIGPGGAAGPEDVLELQRLLYGLYAVLRLHNAQEEEGIFSLLDAAPALRTRPSRPNRLARPNRPARPSARTEPPVPSAR